MFSSARDRRFSNFCLVKILIVAALKKLSVFLCLRESRMKTPGFEANTTLNNIEDQSEELRYESTKSVEPTNGKPEIYVPLAKDKVLNPKGYAKIHDFLLWHPVWWDCVWWGLIGFIFSQNLASLTTNGILGGGAIPAMGIISLEVWRQGLSSLPFVLGQAALVATLLWKHLQACSVMKKIFPSGFYVAMSAAMLCFYSHVLWRQAATKEVGSLDIIDRYAAIFKLPS